MLRRAREVIRGIASALKAAAELDRATASVAAVMPRDRVDEMAKRLGSTREDVSAAISLVALATPFSMMKVIDETWQLEATSVSSWHHKALGRMRELEFRAVMGDPVIHRNGYRPVAGTAPKAKPPGPSPIPRKPTAKPCHHTDDDEPGDP